MQPRLSFAIIFFSLVMCIDLLLAQPYITQSDVPAERGFRTVALLRGLEHPWGMAWLPNGDIIVTERPGRLRRVRDGQLVSDPLYLHHVFSGTRQHLRDIHNFNFHRTNLIASPDIKHN